MARKVITITPLQDLLLRKVVPIAAVRQASARSRAQVWRWAKGISYPEYGVVSRLIELYHRRGHALDYNGCYVPSVAITQEDARTYGLT